MMKLIRYILFGVFVLLLLDACKKREGPWPHSLTNAETKKTIDSIIPTDSSEKFLIICNEGNFGWGNASLSIYYPATQKTINQVFKAINGYDLGDVFQSAYVYNDFIFLMIDNSHKIEVIDKHTFEQIKTINQNIFSPRYFLPVNNHKAYVTSIWGNRIHILDLNNLTVTSSIYSPYPTEKMLLHGYDLLVSCPQNDRIYIVDIQEDKIKDSILTASSPNSMAIDANQHLWVACSGGTIAKYNLFDYTLANEYHLPQNQSPLYLQTDASKNYIYYYSNSKIYKMNIYDEQLPDNPLFNTGNWNVYNFNIDLTNNNLYISDAKDFVQPGNIYRINELYSIIDTIPVGIIPGFMTFKW